ncbi:MAG: dihydroneopterin aldolase [Pseudomonadota bacterium]
MNRVTGLRDEIHIRGLRVKTIIGINEWERRVPQTLTLNLRLHLDIDSAASTQDVTQTLDYGAISAALRAHLARESYQLLETLATALCRWLLDSYPALARVDFEVRKFDVVPGTEYVAVAVSRQR